MIESADRAARCFVVPALGGPITGGTLYNRELIGALSEAAPTIALEPGAPTLGAALAAAQSVWLDSLYLAQAAALWRRLSRGLGLIVHYLPSFVRLGRAASRAELSAEERGALGVADAFLVTSDFMRDALEPLVAPEKPIFVVLPGARASLSTQPANVTDELRALVVANVVPGKGIESLLDALGAALSEGDRLRLSIVGSLDADRPYAERCRRLVREAPLLGARVEFLGARSHAETMTLLAESQLLISASLMESFGMVLAEARVTGIPILARAGGNAGSHVLAKAGGQLVDADQELARACIELARSPRERRERLRLARQEAVVPRSWQAAAREFALQLRGWEK